MNSRRQRLVILASAGLTLVLATQASCPGFVGPNLDIPAPDVGTDALIMGLLLRQYTDGERERHSLRGVVTGKDTRIGGSEGRVKATGQGLAYCIQESFAERGATPAGSTFILQGFGNVGSNAAEILCGHATFRPGLR